MPDARFCECANHGLLDLAAMIGRDRPFAGSVWNATGVPLPDARTTAWAVDFLSRVAYRGLGKPFFLAVGLHGAHSPYVIEDPSSADQAAAMLAASGRLPLDC